MRVLIEIYLIFIIKNEIIYKFKKPKNSKSHNIKSKIFFNSKIFYLMLYQKLETYNFF